MPSPTRAERPVAAAALLGLGLLLAGCAGPGEGSRLYVTSGFTDEVIVLDPRSGRILHRRSLDPRPGERDEPHGVAVSPDGRHWYATLAHGEPTLWKYETAGDRLVGRLTLPTRGASRLALTPDGSRAVVPDYWLGGLGATSELVLVTLESLEIVTVREVCPAPHHAAWDATGVRIAVTCSLSDEIVVLDAEAEEVLSRFPVVAEPGAPGNPVARPMNLAWSPDGARIYASLMREGRIGAYTVEGERLWSSPIGDSPTQIAITPEGGWIVVANRGDATLGLVDTATGRGRTLTLPEAVHPHGLTLSADGTIAYVTHEGTTTSRGGVTAVDLRDGTILWQTEAGVFTLGVALLP